MFCYQCQETSKGLGCEVKGICGKTPEVSALQDLLIYQIKGLSHYTTALRALNIENNTTNQFITESLFMTITNANFDYSRFVIRIREGFKLRSQLRATLLENNVVLPQTELLSWSAITSREMEDIAQYVGVLSTENEDIRSLRELVIYGLKGIAAYLEHAANLGYTDSGTDAFIQHA